ncbi:GDSL esterase/lipase-like protein [Drosera capensis]
MAQFSSYVSHWAILSLLCVILTSFANAQPPINTTPPTIIVFGDSTADPGNNNYFFTWDRSNFQPYGVDFPGSQATGRFSNRYLMPDFAASYLSRTNRTVPAYLDPTLTLQDMIQGISFASAGSGYDPQAAQADGALSLSQQLQNFAEYKTKLTSALGTNATENLISKAIFVVSSGTNDFYDYSFAMDNQRKNFTVSGYQQFLLSQFKNFIQALWTNGAKNIFLLNVPPIGYLPRVMTTYASNTNSSRKSVDSLSNMTKQFNTMLQTAVQTMQTSLVNRTIVYADIYSPITDMVNNPSKYGFSVVDRGCCGTGLDEYGPTCFLSALEHGICSNRSEYFFFDSVHPTDRGNSLIFQALRPTIDAFLKKLY